jgi:hypothetical protein
MFTALGTNTNVSIVNVETHNNEIQALQCNVVSLSKTDPIDNLPKPGFSAFRETSQD